MNFDEALKESLIDLKGITRESWLPNKNAPYVVPTNTSARLIYVSGSQCNQRWMPKAEDLLADDWKVFG